MNNKYIIFININRYANKINVSLHKSNAQEFGEKKNFFSTIPRFLLRSEGYTRLPQGEK